MKPQDEPATTAGTAQVAPRIAAGSTRFALEVRPSPIHRYGVYVVEPVPAGSRVIEYDGERISYREAARRSRSSLVYLFWAAPGRIIDGAVGGSGAEFVNHSCEPNLVVKIEDGRAYFISLREIAADEELLLDYRIHGDAPHMVCRCGSARCRGSLNAS